MTEPEELDEDLFADLYDADEPAASAPAQAQSIPAQEPLEATVPIPTGPPPDNVQEDANKQGSFSMAENQNDHPNGLDERDDSKWDNGGRGSRMDVAAEQDSGGIGIKEDGYNTLQQYDKGVLQVRWKSCYPDSQRRQNARGSGTLRRRLSVQQGMLDWSGPWLRFWFMLLLSAGGRVGG
ncbi:MAG: hypothetical protein LQ344_005034 [Seirophora lacunosa]|nr:MAG: hypothetical protein LQ344_005034 [Seirophora lacunosa]